MPDIAATRLGLVDAFEKRVATGEIPDWETYEASQYGYPTYQHQSYRFNEAVTFIKDSARHIEEICQANGIPLSTPSRKQHAA